MARARNSAEPIAFSGSSSPSSQPGSGSSARRGRNEETPANGDVIAVTERCSARTLPRVQSSRRRRTVIRVPVPSANTCGARSSTSTDASERQSFRSSSSQSIATATSPAPAARVTSSISSPSLCAANLPMPFSPIGRRPKRGERRPSDFWRSR